MVITYRLFSLLLNVLANRGSLPSSHGHFDTEVTDGALSNGAINGASIENTVSNSAICVNRGAKDACSWTSTGEEDLGLSITVVFIIDQVSNVHSGLGVRDLSSWARCSCHLNWFPGH